MGNVTMDGAMSESDFYDALEVALEGLDPTVRSKSFADAGLLTNNDGLVVTLASVDQFQVTVVRSRRAAR